MIMDRFSIWTGTTFLRKWLLERATKKYYQEYFAESRDKTVLEIGCLSRYLKNAKKSWKNTTSLISAIKSILSYILACPSPITV